MFHFKRPRRTSASVATGRHGKSGPTPPQPAVAARPDETALNAGHSYLPDTPAFMRYQAQRLRKEAAGHETSARDHTELAVRKLLRADDIDRLAALGEADSLGWEPPGYRSAETDEAPAPVAAQPEAVAWQPPAAAQMPIIHFRSDPEFWPLCGARKDATWVTDNPDGGVTCPGCLAEMCKDPVPDPTWSPRSVADLAGWSDAATTAPMTVVQGGAR